MAKLPIFVVVFFLMTISSGSAVTLKIGILMDETGSRQQWNYDSYVSTWAIPGADVILEKISITAKDPFQLYTTVCRLVSSGTIAFVTNAECGVLESLSSLINQLRVPLISVGEECAEVTRLPGGFLMNFPPEKPDMSGALKAVIGDLNWPDVLVVYGDEEAVPEMNSVNGVLSKLNATVQSFVVRQDNRVDDVKTILDYLQQHPGIKRHLLLLCDVNCLQEILTQADIYDRAADQQAWFTYDSKWLLIGGREALDLLPPSLGDVINVAVIVPSLDIYNASSSIVMGALAKIRWSLAVATDVNSGGMPALPTQYPSVCGSVLALVENFTQELQMQLSTALCSNCSVYEVHSALFVSDSPRYLEDNATADYAESSTGQTADRVIKRQFEIVGEWQELNGMVMRTRVFPNIQFKLNQKHFVFGTNIWDPFMLEYSNHSSGYGGLCVEILDEIGRNLNFTYSFEIPADGAWGNIVNGSWNGLVGQMQRKEADMTMAPLAINTGREEVMDFSSPYFLEYSTVLVKYTDDGDTKWRLYINPFRWQVWLCVGLAIPCAGVIIFLMTRFSPYYGKAESKKGLGSIENAIFYTFGSFFTQGGVHLPEAQSGRFFIGFWWMYCTVVIATYSGNLIAFLTVSKAQVPFHTLEEMVSQNSHTYGTLGNTALVYHLQISKTGVSKTMWDQMQDFTEADPDIFAASHSKHIEKVMQGGYAYIGDKTSFELEMSKESGCEIDMIKEEFIPYQYAIGFHNRSAYKPSFDEEVNNILESGVINKWKQKWWPRQSFCSRGIVTESTAVSISDVQGAYYLLAIFIVMSFVALLTEKIIKFNKVEKEPEKPAIKEFPDIKPSAKSTMEYDQFGRLVAPNFSFRSF